MSANRSFDRALIGIAAAGALCLGACSDGGQAGGGSSTSPQTNFYGEPPLAVEQFLIAEGDQGAPRELRFFVPTASGQYPLLQFQHGFISDVDTYTVMLEKLAGFGFVVVGPQMYVGDPSTAPGVPDETAAAVQVLAWVQANAGNLIAQNLQADAAITVATGSTGLLGHSRGGQVAWRMLFDHAGDISASAIAGIDPVDGDAPPFPPGGTGELVTDEPGAFGFAFASLIIGMGQGASGAPGFECAPSNRNYRLFYEASAAPKYEVVATGHGHSDMLNGDEPNAVCPGAVDGSRAALRVFIAGQLAAYFHSVLNGQDARALLRDLTDAPVPASGRFED